MPLRNRCTSCGQMSSLLFRTGIQFDVKRQIRVSRCESRNYRSRCPKAGRVRDGPQQFVKHVAHFHVRRECSYETVQANSGLWGRLFGASANRLALDGFRSFGILRTVDEAPFRAPLCLTLKHGSVIRNHLKAVKGKFRLTKYDRLRLHRRRVGLPPVDG